MKELLDNYLYKNPDNPVRPVPDITMSARAIARAAQALNLSGFRLATGADNRLQLVRPEGVDQTLMEVLRALPWWDKMKKGYLSRQDRGLKPFTRG